MFRYGGLGEGLQRITLNINLSRNVTQGLVLGRIFWNVPNNGECTCDVDLGMSWLWTTPSFYVFASKYIEGGFNGKAGFQVGEEW